MEKLNFNKTRFLKVAAGINDLPPQDRPEIVLSGKSNVGKSSLINALGNNRKLAKVSQTPGKTRQIIYFDVDDRLLIADLPGYGYSELHTRRLPNFRLCATIISNPAELSDWFCALLTYGMNPQYRTLR